MPSSYRGSHHRFPSYSEAHRKRWALRLLSAGLQQSHCTTAAVLLCEPVWISVFTAQNLQSQFLSGQNKFSSLWQYIKTFLDIRTKFRHSKPHVGDKNLHPTSISMYLFNQSKNASSYHFYFTVTACWNWKNLLIPPLLSRHSLSLPQWDLRIKYHGTNCVRSPQKLPFFFCGLDFHQQLFVLYRVWVFLLSSTWIIPCPCANTSMFSAFTAVFSNALLTEWTV